MVAHGDCELPENLLPDDVSDLLASLGYAVDRRNVTRALEAADIPGVVPPPSRASRWIIPRHVILDVVAAVLLRRAMRTAAPGRWRVGELTQHRLPAARLLMQVKAFDKFVPVALRRVVKAEDRARRAAEAERERQRVAELERERLAQARAHAHDEKRRDHSATMAIYYECRLQAAAHVAAAYGGGSPEYAAFLRAWPAPDFATGWPRWWSPPPGLLPQAQPWPWRREPCDEYQEKLICPSS